MVLSSKPHSSLSISVILKSVPSCWNFQWNDNSEDFMINNIYNENEINDNGDNSDTGSWIL
jgi:hypothetical protein